jgi:hypothetical protein
MEQSNAHHHLRIGNFGCFARPTIADGIRPTSALMSASSATMTKPTQRGPAGTSRIDSTATPKAGWLFSVPMCWLFSVPMYGTRRLHHFFSPV